MDHHRMYKCVFQFLIGLQIVWALDEVILMNPPEEPVSNYILKIFYSCDEPSTVHLECVSSFDTGTTSTIPLSQWECMPNDPQIKTLILNLPDWLVYAADWIISDTPWVLSSTLQASIIGYGSHFEETFVLDQDIVNLQPVPPLSRPLKDHQRSPSWDIEILWMTDRTSKTQCPVEQETAHLLSSVYASTGENFGITKTLQPYSSEVLEYMRVEAVSLPWCTFSIWVFLLTHCQESTCGVLHHINAEDDFVTPTVLLINSGQLHVQISGESGESTAFLSPFKVPLKQWCHLNIVLRSKMVALSMVCLSGDERTTHSTEHTFTHDIILDDTEGYFVIGGGKFVRGVKGFYGPLVYHRNIIHPYNSVIQSEVVIPELIKNVNLTGWIQTCEDFRFELLVKISGYSLKARQKSESEGCVHVYQYWMLKYATQSKPQCEGWESSIPRRRLAVKMVKLLAFKNGGRGVKLPTVGRALYSLSMKKLGKAKTTREVSRVLPLLLQAGCLRDNQALYLSSVLYSSGLVPEVHHRKAWLLALLAAQKDWRLALLHLGHLHHQGDHGIPSDQDLANAYYANIAQQTIHDRQNLTPEQKYVESIYLNNEEMLKLQTHENHDLFHWLKHQAREGAADAEQAVARMLFWGQQGVSPDIAKAVKHYERGAIRLEDPTSMYDYAIVLLQGKGVKQDFRKAVSFLKKAVEQGFAPAINALGWYYEQFEKDYERAVELWEQADDLGNPEAAMNLGVMYSQGLYPGKAADEFVAYDYYLKSARRGHINAALQVAQIWTTGMHGYVQRRPSDAVLWNKWVAEHNGYLGDILRKALDSYFKGDMLMSVLYYLMAAESGYATAQFNVAYLCDQNTGGFLDPAFTALCSRRYYNLSIFSHDPDSYALIRMGDLLSEGNEDKQSNATAAAQMYTQAALKGEPQGWYSLALLVEEGNRLPISVLTELGLQELYVADNKVLLTTLFGRCRDNGSDAYLPCSLALLKTHLQAFQEDYGATIKFSSVVVMVLAAPPTILIILSVLRRRGLSLHWGQ